MVLGSKPLDLRQARFLYVLGSDMPGIGLGGRVFREEFEDGLVFLVGERLPEGLYILISFRKFSTALVSGSASSSRPDISSPVSLVEFQALPLLCL